MDSHVLISWVAVANDPFNKHSQPGPTLTVLFDPESPYRGSTRDVVLMHRGAPAASKEQEAVDRTCAAIKSRDKGIRLHCVPWRGDDPTEHSGIFAFLKEQLPKLRSRFAGRELVVHISP